MLFITGDCHGKIHRFTTKNFPEQKELSLTKDDYIVVMGDFGMIFDPHPTNEERYLLSWLDDKPWTTLFIDGNHDNHNRLAEFPVTEWNGGRIHQVSDSVYHLIRGEFYDIEGRSCFCFGGAQSHDIDVLLHPDTDKSWKRKRKMLNRNYEHYRVEGVNWWKNEIATDEDIANANQHLDEHNWTCDFVFTHTPPASIVEQMGESPVTDPTAIFLEEVKNKLNYGHWFCGHMHRNTNITDKDHCVYGQITQIV